VEFAVHLSHEVGERTASWNHQQSTLLGSGTDRPEDGIEAFCMSHEATTNLHDYVDHRSPILCK